MSAAEPQRVEVRPAVPDAAAEEEAKREVDGVELAEKKPASAPPASAASPEAASAASAASPSLYKPQRSRHRQLGALLKRNAKVKARQPCASFFEVMLPVIVMLLLVLVRTSVDKEDVPAAHYVDGSASPWNDTTSLASRYQVLASQHDNAAAGSLGYLAAQLEAFNFRLGLAPSGDLADALRERLKTRSNNTLDDGDFLTFDSNAALESYVESESYSKSAARPGILFAVVVDRDGTDDGQWAYRLRGNATADGDDKPPKGVPETWEVAETDDLLVGINESPMAIMFFGGFHALQRAVEGFFLDRSGVPASPLNEGLEGYDYRFAPFPTPAHVEDDFADLIGGFLGLFFTLVYLWPVTRLVKQIVEEKELRVKEAMRIMGLSDMVMYAAWLITYGLVFLLTAVLIVLFTGSTIYENSDKGLVLLFFFLFGMCVFAFCFLISVFFTKARVASTFGALIFFFAFMPYFAVSGPGSTEAQKTLACLSAPICFGLGAGVIAELESADQGVTYSSANTAIDNFRFSTAIAMLVFDFFLYLVFAFYLDLTLPSTFGVRRPHCFCLRPSWWRARGAHGANAQSDEERAADGKAAEADTEAAAGSLEASGGATSLNDMMRGNDKYEEGHGYAAVRVRHLRKQWGGDKALGVEPVVAVDDLSADLYEDQIFALLGHNGAGKSTTINMLSGMFPPSRGDAVLYGNSITENLQEVRESLGYCPQHNVLFDLLTVREHLHMLGTIKGVPPERLDAEVEDMVRRLGLVEKADTRSAALSGGQKRMLSVGIALIGGSRVVFLDEPTSGMDPFARRHTWDLLAEAKRGRVIILTTHFMDEADQLGDRIAIMAKGNIQCLGSSLFLKSRYGVGYQLVVSLRRGDRAGSPRPGSPASGDAAAAAAGAGASTEESAAAASALLAVARRHVPGAELSSHVAGEVSLALPLEASGNFSALLAELDGGELEANGGESYSLSVTTLEEVFLRVGREEEARESERASVISRVRTSQRRSASAAARDKDAAAAEAEVHKTGAPVPPIEKLAALPRARRHLSSLLAKRYKHARRDRKVVMWQVVYPALVMLGGVGLIKLANSFSLPTRNGGTGSFNSPNRVPYTAAAGGCLPVGQLELDAVFAGNNLGYDFDDASVVSDLDVSNALIDSAFPDAQFKESRYGSLNSDCAGESGDSSRPYVTFFVNTTAGYSLPVQYNLLSNMRLREAEGDGAQIALTIAPLPRTSDEKSLTNSLTAVMISIAFAFIPASMAGYVVYERQTKSKHQQLISGVDINAYWLSHYVWDFCAYLVPGLFLLVVLAMFSIDEMLGDATPVTVLLILLHGTAVIPFVYLVSFLFDNHASAQNLTLMGLMLVGAVLLIVSVVLSIIESTRSANESLQFVYRLFPSFCFGSGLAGLAVRSTSLVFGEPKNEWDLEVSGYDLIYLFAETLVYSGAVLLVEYVRRTPHLLRRFTHVTDPGDASEVKMSGGDDSDVTDERARVENGGAQGEMVQVRGLRKVFGTGKVAVRDLWLGVPEGECFGFLGTNGAGKTTSLRMLTADEVPTAGAATLGGFSILTQQAEIRSLIGYCPQFDALIDVMSGREQLELYSRIKGVREDAVADYVQQMIVLLGLEPHADKPSGSYSGGNKRKLSLGIAMVGAPRLLFLDEPSTGVDPAARRWMWDLIAGTMRGRSVLLTTHSMEEAEALCGRIGIFVAGRFRCLGSTTHLRNKYGKGFQVELRTSEAGGSERAEAWFREHLGGGGDGGDDGEAVKVLERHSSNLKVRLDGSQGTLGQIFDILEAGKADAGIVEYALSQTTLEQIFVGFAAEGERILTEQARVDAAAKKNQ